MGYWFFVSYARSDSRTDSKLNQFYKDLIDEILVLRHFPEGEVGFFDVDEIELGALWKDELGRALRTSRVMLALCSPSYFNSEYCGKEFKVFHERQNAYARAHNLQEAPRLILPILWGPPSNGFPELIQSLQYTDPEFPDIYANQGLKYMMNLNRYSDDYKVFVRRLATIIVQEGNRHAMPELKTLRSLESVRSAFAPAQAQARRPGGGPKTGGFRKVWVTYVAARPDELASLRDAVDPYGASGRMEWQPFLPTADEPIGVLAQEVISKQKLFYYPLELETTDSLVEVLQEAEANKEIVIIIVDVWTMCITAYRDFMRPYDRVNLSNCSVLVPWNEKDPETELNRDMLQKTLSDTFRFTTEFKRNSIYYRDSITSDKALKTNLMKTLSDIRMKLLASADDPKEPIQDEQLEEQAREKGITVDTLSTVQSPGGERY
jgi:FxsC-like protein